MRHEMKERTIRLERKAGNKTIIGNVTFIGRPKEYTGQGHWREGTAIKKFMVVHLDDGSEQKVMAEVASLEYYFEHLDTVTTFENVTEILAGDRVVIEVGPRFKGKEFIHTNRVWRLSMDEMIKET